MSDQRVTIEPASLFDNIEDGQIEFTGSADADAYRFALRYDVVEAMSGAIPQGDALAYVQANLTEIEPIAARALGRDYDQELIIISENDLV
ncbi:hypothetical protein [Sphingomonas aerophila]|jgi:hypothetical protein|uniref:DUF1488 family protein n=1 Tax=Sphingomonas aerophila TaxID=1344948 RepID=A0A7W9BCJ4_9SPHN|nr:hypothetical protein [Sphingomonas aerophila]MBB5714523.1 hypothetical protein [Sphingomonas aerophila]